MENTNGKIFSTILQKKQSSLVDQRENISPCHLTTVLNRCSVLWTPYFPLSVLFILPLETLLPPICPLHPSSGHPISPCPLPTISPFFPVTIFSASADFVLVYFITKDRERERERERARDWQKKSCPMQCIDNYYWHTRQTNIYLVWNILASCNWQI